MKYLIWRPNPNDEDLFSGRLDDADEKYLKKVIETARLISDEDYLNSIHAIASTLAKTSYVLDDERLIWCIEWDKFFIAVVFSKQGSIFATAIKALNPAAGGVRVPDNVYLEYERKEDYQRNLVYKPWDAQFDDFDFKRGEYKIATASEREGYQNCLSHVGKLQNMIKKEPSRFIGFDACKDNIMRWAGSGISVLIDS